MYRMIAWNNDQLVEVHEKSFRGLKLGPQSGIRHFHKFSSLVFFILHRVVAWDNVDHIVKLKHQKKVLWPKLEPKSGPKRYFPF